MATTMKPINTIILDGNDEPGALQFASTEGWPGLAAYIPRDDVGHSAVNESFSRPGVYLLVYPQPHGRYPGIYIGSSGDVANRLPQHMTTDKPWTHCYAFTSRDRRLEIQHFQFIEAILVNLAETSGSYAVHNVNRPHAPDLSERDQAIAELYWRTPCGCCGSSVWISDRSPPCPSLGTLPDRTQPDNRTPVLQVRSCCARSAGRCKQR